LKFGIKHPNALLANAATSSTSKKRSRDTDDNNDNNNDNTDTGVDESKMTAAQVAAMSTQQSARQLKKERLEMRRAEKPHHDILRPAKQLWETARTSSNGVEAQRRAVSSLYDLLRGQFAQLTSKHDSSRILQTILKYGDERMRTGVFTELQRKFVDLSMSPYGRFLVVKLFKYSSVEQRSAIFRELQGHIARLARHKEGAKLVEFAYSVQANAVQRARMVEEFYGPDFALHRRDGDQTLAAFFAHTPEKRERVLAHVNERLQMIFSKNSVDFTQSIVHHVLREYLLNADVAAARELAELFVERIAEMLHTKNGAMSAWLVTCIATAKQRKQLVRSVKQYAMRVFTDEWGHKVAVRLLTCVDDTVLLRKMLVSEIVTSLDELLLHRNGRRVILALLRSPPRAAGDAGAFDDGRGALASGVGDESAYDTWPYTGLKVLAGARGDPFVPLMSSDIRALLAKRVRVPCNSTRDEDVIEVSKKDAMMRQTELLTDLAEPLVKSLIAKMPFVLRVYLCFQILEATLLVKPAGEDSHSALCVALVDAIVRDEPLLASDVAAVQSDEAPQTERVVLKAFSANLDDDNDKEGEQGNNDDDDDDDDDNDDNAGDGKKKAVTAPVVAAEAAAAAEFAPPVLTLVSVGRLLKRLMRAGIVCQRKDKQMTLGELLHDVAGAQFVSFAERDGAAFTVLTMLNNASPAFAKVLVRDLKRAKLDDKLNGVKLLKDALQKVPK
jgi:hypothetical protein